MSRAPKGGDSDSARQDGRRKELRPSFCQGTGGLMSKGSPPSSSLGHQPKDTVWAMMREQVQDCGGEL